MDMKDKIIFAEIRSVLKSLQETEWLRSLDDTDTDDSIEARLNLFAGEIEQLIAKKLEEKDNNLKQLKLTGYYLDLSDDGTWLIKSNYVGLEERVGQDKNEALQRLAQRRLAELQNTQPK